MATYKRIASDGKPIEVTDMPYGLNENSGIRTSIKQPVMARDISRRHGDLRPAAVQAHLR